jgi:hypothetical protein
VARLIEEHSRWRALEELEGFQCLKQRHQKYFCQRFERKLKKFKIN